MIHGTAFNLPIKQNFTAIFVPPETLSMVRYICGMGYVANSGICVVAIRMAGVALSADVTITEASLPPVNTKPQESAPRRPVQARPFFSSCAPRRPVQKHPFFGTETPTLRM